MAKKDTIKKTEKKKENKEESFAVIRTGGKQYIVKKGQVLFIEKLEEKEGDRVEFEDVLLVANKDNIELGMPKLSSKVSGKILSQEKGKKIIVFKMKPKKRYRKTQGHRQKLTKVQIEEI